MKQIERFNNYGYWKPLCTNKDLDLIDIELREFIKGKKDYDLEYSLYKYILATDFPVIEFWVKLNFNIPDSFNTIINDNLLYMEKVKFDYDNIDHNILVFDGAIKLKEVNFQSIGKAVKDLEIFFMKLSFSLNANKVGNYKFELKYGTNRSGDSGILQINNFNEVTKNYKNFDYLDNNKKELILMNIRWFQHSLVNKDKYSKFLSMYSVLENLLNSFGSAEKKKKYKLFFFKKSKPRVSDLLENILGSKHKNVLKFNKGKRGEKIYDIRNYLAHGNFKKMDLIDKNYFLEKSCHLELIVKELIDMKLFSTENKNIRNSTYFMGISFNHPGKMGIASCNFKFPRTNWKIIYSWLE